MIEPATETLTRDVLLERARAMRPVLRERAQATEQARQVLPETADEFRRAGFFRICQPKRFGGLELGYDVLQEVMIEIARGCASSSWTLGVLAIDAWSVTMLPEDGQADVYGDGDFLCCGSLGYHGNARPVSGGYEISGKYPYQSGCDVSDWRRIGAIVEDGKQGSEAPTLIHAVVPASQSATIDDWFTLGLRGSGSKTVVFDKVFVPQHHTVFNSDVLTQRPAGTANYEVPLFRLPFTPLSIVHGGTAVGVAFQAADVLEEIGRSKPRRVRGRAGTSFEMENPALRRRLAQTIALAEAAKALLLREAGYLLEVAAACIAEGRVFTQEEILSSNLNATKVSELCVEAVLNAFTAAGTSATFDGNPMERCIRDILTISSHTGLRADNMSEGWGLAHFGLSS